MSKGWIPASGNVDGEPMKASFHVKKFSLDTNKEKEMKNIKECGDGIIS